MAFKMIGGKTPKAKTGNGLPDGLVGGLKMTDPKDPKKEALKSAQNFADSTKLAKTDKIKASKQFGNMARAKDAGMKPHATTGDLAQILGKGMVKGESPKTTEFFVEQSKGMKPKKF